MNLPTFINKWIISNKYLRHTSFWYWFRLANHSNWRMDDYQRYWDFWNSLNQGILDMNYQWEFEKVWGKGAKPEKIVLPVKDFDALVEMLELPSEATMEAVKKLMNRKSPFEND